MERIGEDSVGKEMWRFGKIWDRKLEGIGKGLVRKGWTFPPWYKGFSGI